MNPVVLIFLALTQTWSELPRFLDTRGARLERPPWYWHSPLSLPLHFRTLYLHLLPLRLPLLLF